MGKKGSWFTALKKAFIPSSKEKPTNVQLVAQVAQQRNVPREKKRWGFGRPRQHAEPAPGAFMPLYREPSSIEKILGDAEGEQQHHYYARAQYQITPITPNVAAVARDTHKPVLQLPPPSPPPLIKRFQQDREQQQQQQQQQRQIEHRTETEWRRQPRRQLVLSSRPRAPRPRNASPDDAHAAAIRIQAAFRGYMARRNYRSLRGLIRLQGVMRGQSVRRQTAHAMRCMQMLVRMQAQVRASRVEAMERRSRQQHSAMLRGDQDGRWRGGTQVVELCYLTCAAKTRSARELTECIIVMTTQDGIWNDSLLTRDEADARMKKKVEAVIKRERALAYAYSHQLLKGTPMAAHAILADLQSGRSFWWWTPIERRQNEAHRSEPIKPKSTLAITTTPARSVISTASKARPARPVKGPPPSSQASIRDDESLTSCPPFTVPNYMAPTVSASAKAKARAQVHHQADEKPRFSFGLGQSIGNWAKSPFWKGNGVTSSRVGTPATVAGRHRSRHSISGLSVDSTVSMPAGLGRRPFK